MHAELLLLRLIHILGGIFWLGSGLFTTFFLIPALLTILSGLRLFQIASAGFSPVYVDSRMGQTFLWSGVAAIIAFLTSHAVVRPAMARVGKLGAAMATTPEDQRAARAAEMERLRRRGGRASTVAVVLLTAAAAGMAVARYLG